MPDVKLFDNTMILLKKVLDLRVQNQQIIASNIANANTPGYSPSRLEFEGKLQKALTNSKAGTTTTHKAHFSIGTATIDTVQGKILRTRNNSKIGDGNGVKVDQEMVALAENQILYEAATQMLNKKLGLLKYVAQDGR